MDTSNVNEQGGSFKTIPRVLVVEDEVLVRIAVAEDLRREGFEVLEAQSGDAALALLVGGVTVDLIFTDVRMSGALDGIALAKTVTDEFPQICVVLTSANEVDLDSNGMPHIPFLPKPYRPSDVVDVLRAQLDKQDGPDAEGGRGRRDGSARRRGDPRPA